MSLNATPTIFGGRDEGSYSATAILLTQQHQLEFSNQLINQFFKIYGPGKALNFPGFDYNSRGQLVSQFLPGYPAWLAVWYSWGGLTGLKLANLLPFVTFLFSLFLIASRLTALRSPSLRSFSSWVVLLVLASAFPLIFFIKFSLSEIFFAALIWFAAYLLLKYLSRSHSGKIYYYLAFLPLALALFTRIEALGLIFVLWLFLILRDFSRFKEPIRQLPFLLLGLVVLVAFWKSSHYFLGQIKNFLSFMEVKNQSIVVKSPASKGWLPDDWENFYLLKVFFTYNLLPLLIMAVVEICFIFKRMVNSRQKYLRLFPFIFFSPTLIYLLDASISLDHPWMLRRFLFSLFPLMALYSALFLQQIKTKRAILAWSIGGLLIAINLLIAAPFILYVPNQSLLESTKKIAQTFGPNDLILVSQKSSGSGWALLSMPLRLIYHRSAVYFFNPADLKKLNLQPFTRVYLLTSLNEQSLYQSIPKKKISDYTITNNLTMASRDPLQKPRQIRFQTKGTIFLVENKDPQNQN